MSNCELRVASKFQAMSVDQLHQEIKGWKAVHLDCGAGAELHHGHDELAHYLAHLQDYAANGPWGKGLTPSFEMVEGCFHYTEPAPEPAPEPEFGAVMEIDVEEATFPQGEFFDDTGPFPFDEEEAVLPEPTPIASRRGRPRKDSPERP